MTTETNERGNTIERGSDFGSERYKYDFRVCSPEKGWKQYDTDQDASYFGVWVHVEKRQVFTYAEGDTTLVTCPTVESFRAELDSMAAFYGAPPPAFVAIGHDGQITKYYAARPTAEEQP